MVWERRTTSDAVWPRHRNGVPAEEIFDFVGSVRDSQGGNGVTAMKPHRDLITFAGGIADWSPSMTFISA
jgi:hypothetical protein